MANRDSMPGRFGRGMGLLGAGALHFGAGAGALPSGAGAGALHSGAGAGALYSEAGAGGLYFGAVEGLGTQASR